MQHEDFCNNHWLDSPLHHTADRFESLLQNAVASLDSPMHNAEKRFDSPLHHAAGSQTLILITPRIWKQIWKNLGYKSGSNVYTFDEKQRRWKISCYCPFKGARKLRVSCWGEGADSRVRFPGYKLWIQIYRQNCCEKGSDLFFVQTDYSVCIVGQESLVDINFPLPWSLLQSHMGKRRSRES